MSTHIHIDTIGGLSGDMFIASMLHAMPQLKSGVVQDLQAAGILLHVELEQSEQLVNGVTAGAIDFPATRADPRPTHHYKHIKSRLEKSRLNRTVLERTLAIFDLLAAAEAKVHAVDIEDVHFHEIADWDSQADIVAAASIIEQVNASTWSCSSLPMGKGSVLTEHGRLPVPAPATTELLYGFVMYDDGESGERITPTGAAILRYLINPDKNTQRPNGKLVCSGTGCGKKRFDSLPNIARVMVFTTTATEGTKFNEHLLHDNVSIIQFEVDDMTSEELATGLEQLRQIVGVLDVSHHTRSGKKNRTQFSIQLLCEPEHQDHIVEACFLQTTTIGLRTSICARTILRRRQGAIAAHGSSHPVKQSQRPDGASTVKIEADALVGYSTLAERRKVANDVEQLAPALDD